MSIKALSDKDLISLRDRLQKLYTGSTDKKFIISDHNIQALQGFISPQYVIIQDKRLNNLLFELFIEAHNELCNRFTTKLISPTKSQL